MSQSETDLRLEDTLLFEELPEELHEAAMVCLEDDGIQMELDRERIKLYLKAASKDPDNAVAPRPLCSYKRRACAEFYKASKRLRGERPAPTNLSESLSRKVKSQ